MHSSQLQEKDDARIFAENIVKTIREPLLVLDSGLKVVSANRAFYRQFRVDGTQTEGKRIFDLGDQAWDIPKLRDLLEKIIPENEKIDDFEVEDDFPDIGRRIVRLNARKIRQQSGRRGLILLALEDVTDRVETQRALERSEAKYHRLVEEINSIIIEINANGEIQFFNRFAEKLFGYARQELVGKKLVGTILPETDQYGKDYSSLVTDLIKNPKQFYFNESQGLAKTGKAVHFSWSGRPVKDQKTGEHSILIDGNDITDVQEARRQARISHHILNATDSPIFLLDDRKRLLLANRAFAELAGSKILEIEGGRLSDIRLSDGLLDVLEEAVEASFRDHDHQNIEVKHDNRYFQIRLEPQFENDRMTQALLIFNDISERKRIEDELHQLNAELDRRVSERTAEAEVRTKQLQSLAEQLIEAEENERRRFANLLHSDLQQLLAAAKMRLQNIRERLPQEQQLSYVDAMLEESIEKSRRLSHELSPTVLQHPDFSTALVWLSDQVKNQFGLHVKFPKTDAQVIESAHLRRFLFRAVQEMLFNVVKHAGVKEARIDLSQSKGRFTIRVTDHGSGFDPNRLPSSPEVDGLGLHSIRERATFLGGRLEIDGAPGRGSRLTLTIPLEQAGTDASPVPPGEKEPIPKSRVRVLLADDHKIMRQGLEDLISRQPEIEVVGEAADGNEALAMTRRLKPDVVVMDISMPGMGGIEATRLIKQEMPDICVVGLTMHDEDYLRQAMRKAGAKTTISKAGSLTELLDAIHRG